MNTLNLKVLYQARQILGQHSFEEGEVQITVPSVLDLLATEGPTGICTNNEEACAKSLELTRVLFKAVRYCSNPNHCWHEWELVSWS